MDKVCYDPPREEEEEVLKTECPWCGEFLWVIGSNAVSKAIVQAQPPGAGAGAATEDAWDSGLGAGASLPSDSDVEI